MKLCMMSYTVARLPGFDLPNTFKMTNDLGLEGIDMVSLYTYTAAEVRHMADDHQVPIVAYTFFANELGKNTPEERQAGVDKAKAGIETAVALGAPVVMIPPSPPAGITDADLCRQNYIEGLKLVAPFAHQAGVALTVENFPGQFSPFVTSDDFLQAKAAVPGLKLTFDNGNAASGEDVGTSFRKVAADVAHCHFKDWQIRQDAAEGWRPMRDGRYYKAALIGEGDIDQKATIAAMLEVGYDKYINIEYEGNAYTAAEAIAKAADFLRREIAAGK